MDTPPSLEFSGETPDSADMDDTTMELLSESLTPNMANLTKILNNTIAATVANLTGSDDYVEVPWTFGFSRVAFLVVKCVLVLLVLVLTATIKKDFLKVFVLFLIVPIILECGVDIYTQIEENLNDYKAIERNFTLYQYQFENITAGEIQQNSVAEWNYANRFYSTSLIYRQKPYLTDITYLLDDYLFYSLLFSSIVAFYYAHKAIVKPEEIQYIPYVWSYAKVQIFPVLFVLIDILIGTLVTENSWISVLGTGVVRIGVWLAVITLITQAVASLFLFCRRPGDYTKASPHIQVAQAKWRLFWLMIFLGFCHFFTLPYLFWSGFSLYEDFLLTFGFDKGNLSEDQLIGAIFFYDTHLSCFFIRPIVITLFTILLLAPYRQKFVISFCPCCIKD